MKKLKKILLINWLYFSKELIEVDDINFLTGKNGAGKSTVIDALQIVLWGERIPATSIRQPMKNLSGRWRDTCGRIWMKIIQTPDEEKIFLASFPANFGMMWRVSPLFLELCSTAGAMEAVRSIFSFTTDHCRKTALFARGRPSTFLTFVLS